jgi:hypothetical protein
LVLSFPLCFNLLLVGIDETPTRSNSFTRCKLQQANLHFTLPITNHEPHASLRDNPRWIFCSLVRLGFFALMKEWSLQPSPPPICLNTICQFCLESSFVVPFPFNVFGWWVRGWRTQPTSKLIGTRLLEWMNQSPGIDSYFHCIAIYCQAELETKGLVGVAKFKPQGQMDMVWYCCVGPPSLNVLFH